MTPEEKVEAVVETGDRQRLARNRQRAGPAKVGLLHDTLRRAKKQPTLLQKVSDEYPDFKKRMEDEHGLTWSFSLSYRQRWVHPDNIGTFVADPVLAHAELGHFRQQNLRLRLLPVLLLRRAPQRQQGHRQPRVTHVERRAAGLPEQVFANHLHPHAAGRETGGGGRPVLLLQFRQQRIHGQSATEFRQLHLLGNGSATYPTTGTGGYVQFNATKTLQLIAGGQSVNVEDPSKRPTDGFLSSPYAWLGYVQWTPAFKGLGDAQYSLTLYQAPAVTERPASRGWSINAVQHLNDRWAVFGRLNASNDDSGGNRRSGAIGVALNNPLGSRRWRPDRHRVRQPRRETAAAAPEPEAYAEHAGSLLELEPLRRPAADAGRAIHPQPGLCPRPRQRVDLFAEGDAGVLSRRLISGSFRPGPQRGNPSGRGRGKAHAGCSAAWRRSRVPGSGSR